MTITPEWFGIIAQAIVIVFLAGKGLSRLDAVERTMNGYERRLEEKDKAASTLIDRLARIEEKLNHIDDSLSRRNGGGNYHHSRSGGGRKA